MGAPKPSPPGTCQNWWLLISRRTKAAVAWRCQSDAGTFLISWGFPIGLGEWCPSSRWDAGGPQSACAESNLPSDFMHPAGWSRGILEETCTTARTEGTQFPHGSLAPFIFIAQSFWRSRKKYVSYLVLWCSAYTPSWRWSPAVTDHVGCKALPSTVKCPASVPYMCFLCMMQWQRRSNNLFFLGLQ